MSSSGSASGGNGIRVITSAWSRGAAGGAGLRSVRCTSSDVTSTGVAADSVPRAVSGNRSSTFVVVGDSYSELS